MAAYAAVVSLMNIMEQIRNHPRLSTSFDQNQIESLGEILDFLLDFIESDGGAFRGVEDLGMKIASAAHAAEDVIESQVVDQIHAGFPENGPSFSIDLQKIIQDMMSLVKEEIVMAEEERSYEVNPPRSSTPAAPSERPSPSSGRNTMVGFDDVLIQLLDRLTDHRSGREVIPIVGAGGIGKTTLARNCYENILIREYFDICAWASVSQDYSVSGILLQLVSCIRGSAVELSQFNVSKLGEELHKCLYGSRYLIILDDMWSVEAWDKINFFFPDNNNGSRIIITTRLSNLASHLSSFSLMINLLDEYESWNLFCQKVFGDEDCPSELEEIGRKIARYCRGLPLAITVVGGLLRLSSRMREHWEHVAQNMDSILNSGEGSGVEDILRLSYNALPACLKPCFLYLGIFPEDHEFRVSHIIKLWVAEGFLKPCEDRTLEDVGAGFITDLVDRNLLFVSTAGSNGKPKNCKMHDLLRDLCIRLADKEKFLSFVREGSTPESINSERRFVVHDSNMEKNKYSEFFHAMEATLISRSLIHESPALLSFKSRLLRVLVEVYSDSLESTFQQVNLRFLAYESLRAPIGWIPSYELPSSISLLWNVQTLKIDKKIEEVVAPSEIWEMPQLRHLCFNRISLPEPPASDDGGVLVLQNLQTLRTALNFKCCEEVCKRMPNMKKLRVLYDDFSGEGEKNSWYCIDHIGHFTGLESLYLCFHKVPNRDGLLQNLSFPNSLRKLILQDCELYWDDLSIIGSLPNLKVLKLKSQSVRGPKWETVEGEFPSLRMLEIDSCYLNHWFSEFSHFPSLEKLVLCRLHRLSEIPPQIGDVVTLRNIYVVECSISAAISAARMLNEQEEWLGESFFKVRVRFKTEKEVAEFTAKVEVEGLSSPGLQIEGV